MYLGAAPSFNFNFNFNPPPILSLSAFVNQKKIKQIV